MNNSIKVIQIKKSEVEQAATTLFHAFKTDPLIQWIFVSEKYYDQNGLSLFETWVRYSVMYGMAVRTPNFESVALRKKPGDTKFTLWRLFRSGMLSTPKILGKEGFDRLMRFDKFGMKERKNNMDKQLFWYCWMLGTRPEDQQKGFAKMLIKYTFDRAKQDNLPCYLEASSEKAKQVHLSQGYRALSEFMLPESNVKLTAMMKDLI